MVVIFRRILGQILSFSQDVGEALGKVCVGIGLRVGLRCYLEANHSAFRQFNGIISPPQTAILAIGSLAPRPVVVDGAVAVAPTMYLTVSLDHRVHDGKRGAEFLAAIAEALEDEERLAGL